MEINEKLSDLEDVYLNGLHRILDEVKSLEEVRLVADHVANMAGGPVCDAAALVRDTLDAVAATAAEERHGGQSKVQDAHLNASHAANLLQAVETLASEAYALLGPLAASGFTAAPGRARP